MALDQAIDELMTTLEHPQPSREWCSQARLRLAAVGEALATDRVADTTRVRDGWLSARGGTSERERARLMVRISALGRRLRDRPDVSSVELHRLALDLEHYRQRLHDLVYDTESLELGGSE